MNGFDVPVVLTVFNRPEQTARVLAVLRQVRPATLLLVADGPRADQPEDALRCAEVRAIVDDVDWPCTVSRDFSDHNLGCDRRIVTGLDWAFSLVDRAIVLEDDIVPDPSFFPWCAAMLDRYGDAPDVLHVSGRNTLGRHGPPGVDHLVVRRGSGYGWATWADAWRAVDPTLGTTPHDPAATIRRVDALGLDPLLRAHLLRTLTAAEAGTLGAWDCTWWASCALREGWAVAPPVNLVHNIGFGQGANRTVDGADFRALPVGVAPAVTTGAFGRPAPDPDYDRRSLLVEEQSGHPTAVGGGGSRGPPSRREPGRRSTPTCSTTLAPFDQPAESLAALAGCAAGVEHRASTHSARTAPPGAPPTESARDRPGRRRRARRAQQRHHARRGAGIGPLAVARTRRRARRRRRVDRRQRATRGDVRRGRRPRRRRGQVIGIGLARATGARGSARRGTNAPSVTATTAGHPARWPPGSTIWWRRRRAAR
ncbi:MAG: hypothetical protein U0W40_16805 [Acidimicrobiia bacterium]